MHMEPKVLYPHDTTIWADRLVTDSSGVTFVRVQGTKGWLFTTRDGKETLKRVPRLQDGCVASTSSSSVALPIAEVRNLAARYGWSEVQYSAESRVIAFTRMSETNGRMRVNVYYTTGTVGTSLNHPVDGPGQMFRRCTSLNDLERIFSNPRVHTERGYKRRRNDPLDGARLPVDTSCIDQSAESEETIARRMLVEMDLEAAALAARRAQLAKHIRVTFDEPVLKNAQIALKNALLEAARRAAEKKAAEERALAEKKAAEKAALEAKRAARGTSISSMLYNSDDTKDSFSSTVTCVATNGYGTIMLYESGSWAFSRDLPTGLYNKLHGRSLDHSRPSYVALGTQESYYIRFRNGSSQWAGPDGLSTALHETSRTVASVAFGEDYHTWFIVYTDGYWEYNGDIPSGLDELMDSRKRRADLSLVTLGPDGEYFLKAQNGKTWWGGISTAMSKTIRSIGNDRLKFMDFGEDNTYFIRYS
ncbi:Aste57867_15909 protein [Pycnococcus provasolii]